MWENVNFVVEKHDLDSRNNSRSLPRDVGEFWKRMPKWLSKKWTITIFMDMMGEGARRRRRRRGTNCIGREHNAEKICYIFVLVFVLGSHANLIPILR